MSDPKHEKPESDHPHEDDLPIDIPEGGVSDGDEQDPLDALGLTASSDEFDFSGPIENLDFSEPSGFEFPTVPPAEAGIAAETAATEDLSAAELASAAELPATEAVAVEAGPAEEQIVDIPAVEEAAEEEQKPKFKLPPWFHMAEWIVISVVGVGALLAVVGSVFFVKDAKLVTLILDVGCPVMLGLIPYALWRSSARWTTPEASAIYTVMLALGAAALVAGTWSVGQELSRYGWKFSKADVQHAKPVVILSPPPQPTAPPAKPPVEKPKNPSKSRAVKK